MAGFVPHDWLFDRVSAVVHHGGAGTTAAGITAGRPTLVVPFGGDQPFWATRVKALGIGPHAIPRDRLTAPRLARALTDLTETPKYRVAARELGERLRLERGEFIAANIIEHELRKWLREEGLPPDPVAGAQPRRAARARPAGLSGPPSSLRKVVLPMDTRTLADLRPGESGVVAAVGGEDALHRHLLDMGITPGVTVLLQKTAPMGDPVEIRLRGYALTLRLDDARKITLR